MRKKLASQTAEPDFEPTEIPDAAPDEELVVREPAVIPVEPEIDFDLGLRPMDAGLPVAA